MSNQKSKKRNIKTILQNLALICTSIIIFTLILEVILRGMEYGNLVIYQPDPNLVWEPIPNQNCYTKFGHKPIHINDEGIQGKHFSKYKEKKTFKILSPDSKRI